MVSQSNRGTVANDGNVLIAVMGATGSGKTSFINLVSGSNLRVGRGLSSCTAEIQLSNTFELDGRHVTIIDTPGFDDTTMSDTVVLKKIAAFLATAYENQRKLAGVLYFHRISDFRIGGTSARNFKMFKKLCGDNTLKNVVVVTNMWGEVSREIGEDRETELRSKDIFFKPVFDNGGQLYRHENTFETGRRILRSVLQNHPLPLRIQRELVDEGKDIMKTAAAEELNRELVEQLKRHREEMRALREEMREALLEKDEETRKVLDAETKKLQEEMTRLQTDHQNLESGYQEEKRRLEQLVQDVTNTAKAEVAAASAEHRRQLEFLRQQRGDGGFTLVCCIQ